MVNIVKIAPLNYTKYLFCVVDNVEIFPQIFHYIKKAQTSYICRALIDCIYPFFKSNHTAYIRKSMVF